MQDIQVECRKFNLTPTLSLHYLDQCTKNLQKSILASGASFLLIQGTDIKVYNELKRYFEKDGSKVTFLGTSLTSEQKAEDTSNYYMQDFMFSNTSGNIATMRISLMSAATGCM